MLDLTDSDLDALHAIVRKHVPRITRETFPAILAQLVSQGRARGRPGPHASRTLAVKLWNEAKPAGQPASNTGG